MESAEEPQGEGVGVDQDGDEHHRTLAPHPLQRGLEQENIEDGNEPGSGHNENSRESDLAERTQISPGSDLLQFKPYPRHSAPS